MHLCTEVPAASSMLGLFGEVGGGVPEYFSSEKYVRKSYREKIVLKTLQLEFSTAVQFYY